MDQESSAFSSVFLGMLLFRKTGLERSFSEVFLACIFKDEVLIGKL